MKQCSVSLLIVFASLLLVSCHDKKANINGNLSIADYAALDTSLYRLSNEKIRQHIDQMAKWDDDSMAADYRTRSYYGNRNPLVWIDRRGLDHRADSLLNGLRAVADMGFGAKKFRLARIADDIRRFRELDFDSGDNQINKVAGRLEYNLTKAYLRYVAGQRFGFFNPMYAFNHLDKLATDDERAAFRTLFDIKVERAGREFYNKALDKVREDSVAEYMREVETKSVFYRQLKRMLRDGHVSKAERVKILVNMERCRWRMPDTPESHEKYVLVNIPSYHLLAVDGKKWLTMRTAFGANGSKTPQMISSVTHVNINPQWVMPRSIVRKTVARHAGDSAYFAQRRYFVIERSTGQKVSPRKVTAGMLLSGRYAVVQRGGQGNAMGRMVFRFRNNFSIYLHDTSSRSVFDQKQRDVSHGCVRVEKPFELTVFLLDDKDGRLIEKIKYSINADVSPVNVSKRDMTDNMRAVADTLDMKKLVTRVGVKPPVPIFILYYTMYPGTSGLVESFDDVYGFDDVIYRHLRNYL